MNVRKQVNIQSDREFQVLSEYLLTFPKDNYSSHDPSKVLIERMARRTSDWEFDHEVTSTPFDLFFIR